MLTRCIYCAADFVRPRGLGFRSGRRIAYDPGRGRLWAVCDRCHGWTLAPTADRGAVLHRLERAARDRGHVLARTDHVSLLELDSVQLVRVGPRAGREEEAWWRFGRRLRRRRDRFRSPGTRLAAYAFGAVAHLGELMGVAEVAPGGGWDDRPVADLLRWRRFGWAAWYGREPCPDCGSVLRALRFDISWWIYPLVGDDGRFGVGVPCSRCDPWTPEKLHRIRGPRGEDVLRRVLAYQNVAGVGERTVRTAVREIEAAGSAGAFGERVAGRRETLWRSGEAAAAALEIALNESVERRLLESEVRALDLRWRREEELARITDEELSYGARPPGPVAGGQRGSRPRDSA